MRGQEMMSTPAVAIRMASAQPERDVIAQEDQAEDGDLHGLGLDVGGGDDEGALLHDCQQQGGGGESG